MLMVIRDSFWWLHDHDWPAYLFTCFKTSPASQKNLDYFQVPRLHTYVQGSLHPLKYKKQRAVPFPLIKAVKKPLHKRLSTNTWYTSQTELSVEPIVKKKKLAYSDTDPLTYVSWIITTHSRDIAHCHQTKLTKFGRSSSHSFSTNRSATSRWSPAAARWSAVFPCWVDRHWNMQVQSVLACMCMWARATFVWERERKEISAIAQLTLTWNSIFLKRSINPGFCSLVICITTTKSFA